MGKAKPLARQTALVTGASSGIGKAIALAMGEAGANVAVNFRSREREAREVAREIERSGSRALAVQADVGEAQAVERLFGSTLDTFGSLDILVSNAGIQRDAPFLEMTFDQWQLVLNVNLNGAFLCAQKAARIFRKQGVRPDVSKAAGKIIFTSSVHEVIPWAGHVNYATAKGGIMLLMKSIAQELAPHKVRVNSIGPGAIKTAINQEMWTDPEAVEKVCRLIPYQRLGEPEDVAALAVWLASDEADYIHGTTVYIDGGMLLYPGFRAGG